MCYSDKDCMYGDDKCIHCLEVGREKYKKKKKRTKSDKDRENGPKKRKKKGNTGKNRYKKEEACLDRKLDLRKKCAQRRDNHIQHSVHEKSVEKYISDRLKCLKQNIRVVLCSFYDFCIGNISVVYSVVDDLNILFEEFFLEPETFYLCELQRKQSFYDIDNHFVQIFFIDIEFTKVFIKDE